MSNGRQLPKINKISSIFRISLPDEPSRLDRLGLNDTWLISERQLLRDPPITIELRCRPNPQRRSQFIAALHMSLCENEQPEHQINTKPPITPKPRRCRPDPQHKFIQIDHSTSHVFVEIGITTSHQYQPHDKRNRPPIPFEAPTLRT
jgi:hypothetical protein